MKCVYKKLFLLSGVLVLACFWAYTLGFSLLAGTVGAHVALVFVCAVSNWQGNRMCETAQRSIPAKIWGIPRAALRNGLSSLANGWACLAVCASIRSEPLLHDFVLLGLLFAATFYVLGVLLCGLAFFTSGILPREEEYRRRESVLAAMHKPV